MVVVGNYCTQRQHMCNKCGSNGTCLVTGCIDYAPVETTYSSNSTSVRVTYIPCHSIVEESNLIMRRCQLCDGEFNSKPEDEQYICNECRAWFKVMKQDYKKASEFVFEA